MQGLAAFRVDRPGLLTTIQDAGRTRYRSSGIPAGGVMDRFAFLAANLLVGNAGHEPVLEITVLGPTLTALSPCLIAITGADLNPAASSTPLPGWTSVHLEPGQQVRFGERRYGARAYLAVAGGFIGERWLGSESTDLLSGRGGFAGRTLRSGDDLRRRIPTNNAPAGRVLAEEYRPRYSSELARLSVIPGPHISRLSRHDQARFFDQQYQVSPASNRMGYRLEGNPLGVTGPELISFGVTFGCVQLPRNGKPILLMADHQSIGGYPVVATVVRHDLVQAAQLAPGDSLRFQEVSPSSAESMWNRLLSGLGEALPDVAPKRELESPSNSARATLGG